MLVKLMVSALIVVILLSGCNKKNQQINFIREMKDSMMATEQAFSLLSVAKGTRKALIEYIDSNGVLLRPNSFPLIAADAIDFISQANDSSYTMIWQSKGGNVANSGELGYTYGMYSISPKNKDTVLYGTYVNIWKKQLNGKWKLLLDSGNDGIKAIDN